MMFQWRDVSCLLANILLVTAVAIFAIGFFPHKAFFSGLSGWPENHVRTGSTPFDKVIFMVVDALRSDFVYGEYGHFRYTQGLVRSGAALPLTGHASPPTITMPRIKAITTGSVPSFLDLMLNFAESDKSSSLASQDTWLAQMKAKKTGKLVMYGDDTWLRLFPDFFDRLDGTTSFFVSDFTEVDNNVTRHVPEELKMDDWSVMVMHYLGLDHIGHKTGPKGPSMPAKQREMDTIVKQIYEAMETESHLRSALLVLLGDHGMNEAGNHGASSGGEVSTALTFISPRFKSTFGGLYCPVSNINDFRYYDEVEQSDIAPSLAALLGFPMPKNNLGIIIPKILELWENQYDRFELLEENAIQIHEVAKATFPAVFKSGACDSHTSNDIETLACAWLRVQDVSPRVDSGEVDVDDGITTVLKFLHLAQDLLSGTASNYDLSKMWIAIALAIVSVAFALFACGATLLPPSFASSSFLSVTLAYSATIFASSYVEEEQDFWYWSLSAWLNILNYKQSRTMTGSTIVKSAGSVSMLLLFGIARRWNQTGQKYAGNPDLLSEMFSTQTWLLWLLIVLEYANISQNLSSRVQTWQKSSQQLTLLPPFACLMAFTFKIAFTAADAPELLQGVPGLVTFSGLLSKFPLVNLARLVFLGIGYFFACAIWYEAPWKGRSNRKVFFQIIHHLLTLLLVTQTRTANIPLFLIFATQLSILASSQSFDSTELTTTSLLFQFSSFFMLGGSNAISSVDLSNAYNGIAGYNVGLVGLLVFLSNWSGPIWWTSATYQIFNRNSPGKEQEDAGSKHFALLSLFATVSTLAVMVACTVLREHLFIWTVFSPKYLYTIAWVLGQHLFVNGMLGTVLGW